MRRFHPRSIPAVRLLSVCWLLVSATASAQVPLLPDEVQRVDVIAIEQDGRDLFAFDALTGRRAFVRLELGEEVVFRQSRGRIGLVLTDRRALGVAPGTDWRELRYRLQDPKPEVGLVEDRVALVVAGKRALGFVGKGVWVEERLTPNEKAEALRTGSAAAVVVTNRRALGLSPDLARFVEIDFEVREKIESVNAQDTVVTLRTSRRILVFSAPRAFWTDQARKINRDL